jgi:predicted DNA-binding transcriptional regulator YafY
MFNEVTVDPYDRADSIRAVGLLDARANERLVFIDFRCTFLGELRRGDLMARFNIGSAAATRDIAEYRNNLGGKIELDPVSKTYRLALGFTPIFAHEVEQALTALSRGFGETQITTSGALINCEIPPHLSSPSLDILAPLCRAIHAHRAVQIGYSSFTSGKSIREIVPFALANNGLRWHVRAFDRKREDFVDFVLTRIHAVIESDLSAPREHELEKHDIDWGRVLELQLVAHPKEEHPEVVALDYKMVDGVLKVRVRAALASYLLRQWLVDCSTDHSLSGTEYRLWLKNAPTLYGVANAHLAPGYKE